MLKVNKKTELQMTNNLLNERMNILQKAVSNTTITNTETTTLLSRNRLYCSLVD